MAHLFQNFVLSDVRAPTSENSIALRHDVLNSSQSARILSGIKLKKRRLFASLENENLMILYLYYYGWKDMIMILSISNT